VHPLAPEIALAESVSSVGTIFVFEDSLLEEGIVSCVLLLFLAFRVICTLCALCPAQPLRPRYGRTVVHMPDIASCSLFHASPFHWTKSPPRGSSSVADANENIDDAARIPTIGR
jgi:hypothetical protein